MGRKKGRLRKATTREGKGTHPDGIGPPRGVRNPILLQEERDAETAAREDDYRGADVD